MTTDVLREVFAKTYWFVDGYRILATGELHARESAKAFFGIDGADVHPWVDGVDVETGDPDSVGVYLREHGARDEEIPFENVEAMYFSMSALGGVPDGLVDTVKAIYEHYECFISGGVHTDECLRKHDGE